MLVGKGFDKVYNLAGGIKGWNSEVAFGSEDQGLAYFKDSATPEESLMVAYSLEQGLRDFYLSMLPEVKNDSVKSIFQKLADIEINHQNRLYDEYIHISAKEIDRQEFEQQVIVQAAEGGLTTQEYLDLFKPDLESVTDIISLAMSIEAQALDLYQRAAERASNQRSQEVLKRIADEERSHLNQLGELIDQVS
jgi:rubrerythrin